jgi:hypothetical protein
VVCGDLVGVWTGVGSGFFTWEAGWLPRSLVTVCVRERLMERKVEERVVRLGRKEAGGVATITLGCHPVVGRVMSAA